MSIDIHEDDVLSLSQVAQSLPGRPSVRSVWRWVQRGVRGVKLETVLIGGRRYSSRRAVGEFVAHTTAAADHSLESSNRAAVRGRAGEAKAELDQAGIN